MIKIILHQLWNQRALNGWIFAELLVAGFFLWTALDPVCVLTANYCMDRGYEPDGRYVLQIGRYEKNNGNYKEEFASDSLSREDYYRIIRIVREQPEVECYSVSSSASFPNSASWNSMNAAVDSAALEATDKISVQNYSFVQFGGSNLFRTYGMKDARTGGEVVLPEDVAGKVFVSENVAHRLFGTLDVVGQKIYKLGEIAGVVKNVRHYDYEQPFPLMISVSREMEANAYMNWRYNLVIKLKKGVRAETFEKRFREEVAPQLSVGNFYFSSLDTFSELSDKRSAENGYTNKLRLQYTLAGFAMLCIFLGMVGTFWIRCDARRQEIGVMCSMGASRRTICRQMLTEAALLVTAAFVLILPLLLYNAHENGMYVSSIGHGTGVPDSIYWQNNFAKHFAVVSVVSYVVLLTVALLATYIPVRRASRTLPAEALKDE